MNGSAPINGSEGLGTLVQYLNYPAFDGNPFTYNGSNITVMDYTVTPPVAVILPAILYQPGLGTPLTPIKGPTDTDPPDAVFVDGTKQVNGDGTKANPYNNYPDAYTSASAVGKDIYVRGTVTVTGAATSYSGPANHTVYRSSVLNGYVFDIQKPGSLTLSNITIDGNAAKTIYGSSLIGVDSSGSLVLNSGTNLQNNKAGSGDGIRIYSGNVTMNSGVSITTCSAVADAGAVAVFTNDAQGSPEGTFTMNGGTLSGNEAGHNGGAVYTQKGSVFTLAGGSITGNSAPLGNGIYVSANGNPANPAELTLSPNTNLTLGSTDDVYIPEGVEFFVQNSLAPSTVSDIYLTYGTTDYTDVIVALASSPGVASESAAKLFDSEELGSFYATGTAIHLTQQQ
jgi:predicted outer membrane repeat protein